MEHERVKISDFYKNRCVFLTGGTGFIGKVLVYKLLKSCPDIKCIYILMRPKCGEHVNARLSKLINGGLFKKMREVDPLILNKIIPIPGDLLEPNLGISEINRIVLNGNVSVVFHLAAANKFGETLKNSISTNVLGTLRLMELCHEITHLEVLVHISTAYSNCDRQEIMEVIYPPLFNPDQLIESVEWMDDELLNGLTPKLLGNHPNTYTFTKAFAEHVVLRLRGNLPTAIIRPTLVLSSLSEPEPGWIESWNGPNKIVAVCGRGNFRSLLIHKEKHIDVIPVDFVVNLIICAAWRTATYCPDDLSVYNCCSGLLNPIKFETFIKYVIQAMHKYPSMHLDLKPKLTLFRSRTASRIADFFLHIVPSLLYDSLSCIFGRSSCRYNTHRKLCEDLKKLEYFFLRDWQFVDYNVSLLSRSLSQDERAEFVFDVTQIDWQKYIYGYVFGIRRYVLNESVKTIQVARVRQRRLVWIEKILKLSTAVVVFSLSLLLWLKRVPYCRYFFINLIVYSSHVLNMW